MRCIGKLGRCDPLHNHVQRDHQDVRLTAGRIVSKSRRAVTYRADATSQGGPPPPRRYRAARLSLLLAAVLPTACGLFLESYHIDDSKLRGAACQLGELRCVGDWLLTCAPTLDGWVDSQACSLPEQCDSAQGTCRVCANGEYRCDGASLQVCNAERSGWDTVETCAMGTACNLNLQACAPCTPNEYQCNGGVLTQCSAQGSWGAPTQCGSPELCVVSETRTAGQCLSSAKCKPGEYTCQDARLVRCDAQGVLQLGIETCASAALCRQSLSAGGAAPKLFSCIRPTCDANQARCDGNQLLLCSPDRTGFTQARMCSADNPCNPKLRDCGRCTPGEKVCSGPDLLNCDANGVFQRAETCASSALCNVEAGACDPKCDDPGRAHCDPTLPLLSQCGEDLKPRDTSCGNAALCNARDARCEVPRCDAGAVRCDGQRLQHCNGERTGWETDLTCEAGNLCDPVNEKCVPGACEGTGYRCNDVFLERCTTNGFQRVARCAVASLCHADQGTCAAPECAPGTFSCTGKFLKKCDEPTRTWIDADTCVGQCDDISGKCL
jgi:hypothetical protein